MKKIVVNDTNVFIDLLNIGLLEEFFQLPWEIHTTDFVMWELLKERQREAVANFEAKGLLHVASFDFDEIQKINKLHKRFDAKTNVSITDCSVLYYAKQNNYTLLTGDHKLRNSATREEVEVRGIIYVFDELVGTGVIPWGIASEKLTLLKDLNPRLPKDEIDTRLRMWSSGQNKEGGCL